jgi:hypothetical protein
MADPTDSYISTAEFLRWPGVDVSRYTDSSPTGELATILRTAKTFVDALTGTDGWNYRTVLGEEQPLILYSNGTWQVVQQYTPLRSVLTLDQVYTLGQNAADTPIPVPVGSYRSTDDGVTSRWLPYYSTGSLPIGGFGLTRPLDPPIVRLSYTAGYDDGDLQADDLSYPYPDWLRDGTRVIATALIQQDVLSRMGMGGLEQIKVGFVEARRAANTIGFTIPPGAELLLKNPPTRDMSIVLR